MPPEHICDYINVAAIYYILAPQTNYLQFSAHLQYTNKSNVCVWCSPPPHWRTHTAAATITKKSSMCYLTAMHRAHWPIAAKDELTHTHTHMRINTMTFHTHARSLIHLIISIDGHYMRSNIITWMLNKTIFPHNVLLYFAHLNVLYTHTHTVRRNNGAKKLYEFI